MEPFSRFSTASSVAALQQSSDLFRSQSWFPINPWQERVFEFKDTARSYMLVEARLYKNEYNVEHEFIVGEFRANSEVIFVVTERVTALRDSDHKLSDEESHRILQELKAEEEKMERPKMEQPKRKQKRQQTPKIPNLKKTAGIFSRIFDHGVRADDKVRLILGAQDFDAALKIITNERLTKNTFILRGSLKYRFDTEPNAATTSICGDPLPTPLRPDLLNFTAAISAIHRSKPWYTMGHNNSYWFAKAMMFILSQRFTPSEPVSFDITQGTWSFGLLTIPLGGLEREDEAMLLEAYSLTVSDIFRAMVVLSAQHVFVFPGSP
jgi:hypothetical protein